MRGQRCDGLHVPVMRLVGQHPAFVEHGHASGTGTNDRHVVLHHHHGALRHEGGEQRRGALHLLRRHAGHGLVDQQELRILGEQHADLQPLGLAVGEPAGEARRLGHQPDGAQQRFHAIRIGGALAIAQGLPRAAMAREGKREIATHGFARENRRTLELAADTEAGYRGLVVAQQVDVLPEEHRARVRARPPRDHVHERGLAGAIGPDDAAQLARIDGQAETIEGAEAGKAHADILEVEHDPVPRVEPLSHDSPGAGDRAGPGAGTGSRRGTGRRGQTARRRAAAP